MRPICVKCCDKKRPVHIEVFVTRDLRFRAKICEAPAYEVTVGGAQWMYGKGVEHKDRILKRVAGIIDALKNEQKYIRKNS